MKKVLQTFLFALAVGMMAKAETSGLWTNYKAENFSSVNTENKTLTINTAGELALLTYHVYNSGAYRDYNITLAADLDMSGHFWLPIGLPTAEFTGTFDGQGHTISNLDIWVKQQKDGDEPDPGTDVMSNGNVAGLFGKIGSGGIVKDVYVSGPYVGIKNPWNLTVYIGGIAGINEGKIVGCGNAAELKNSVSSARVGGIAGENSGTIQNCYNIGGVYSSNSDTGNHFGGIAGYNTGKVQNCFMRSTIDINNRPSRSYSVIGNGSGTVSASFYANGTADDVPYTGSAAPIAIGNASDNNSILSTNNGQTKHMLLDGRTLFTDGDWNTICLPFSVPMGASGYSPIAGASVMELDTETSGYNASTGVLTLNFTDVTTGIVAGKPYIVKWDKPIADNIPNPVFLDVKVAEKSESERSVTTKDEKVTFQGIFSSFAIAEEDKTKLFLGEANTLYYPNAAMTINSCRAYFSLSSGVEVRSCVLNFGYGEETTSIHAPQFTIHAEGDWYDLNGRKLNGKPMARGIYIKNGRKVVIN